MSKRLPYIEATADIQGEYRYHLRRIWQRVAGADMMRTRNVAFVMLNPSTADGAADDATIRRCVGFAKSWGYEGLDVVNLYALRSRDPYLLRTHANPVGPENDEALFGCCRSAELVVAAWGARVEIEERARAVQVEVMLSQFVDLHALGTTQDGWPRHPLYVRADAKPFLYRPRKRKEA